MSQPKLLQLTTPTVRNYRTLVWLQQQSETNNWYNWDGIVTSLSDYHKWDDQGARIAGLVLTSVDRDIDSFLEELYTISKNVLLILLPQSILSLRSEAFWVDNFDNVLDLDHALESYPFLLMPWNNTAADAIAIFAILCRYNRLMDCPLSPERFSTTPLIVEHDAVPSEIYLITQYFVHSNKKRAKEIKECLIKNCANPLIDTIVLLNEKDLSHEWSSIPGKEKIKQVIVGTRLTYATFLSYVATDVPANVYTILCNADIYMGSSLNDLWKIDLNDRMLALLRWDDPDDGGKPHLFGPRADSQDTWILLSDSIKKRNWDFRTFDFSLGQAGCDNAFAGHMLRNRFVLSNPAMTFQTFHLHTSNIRNYSKKDYIRSDLYINLVPTYLIDTKQEQTPKEKPNHICNELVTFEVKSNSMSNEITFCTMLEKEGRYKWEPSVENHSFEPAIPVYSWKGACVTPNGLVYDPYTIYTGKHSDNERFHYWTDANVDIFTPLQQRKQMLAIPFANTRYFQHPNTYLLNYVSRCARLLKEYPTSSFWIPKDFLPMLNQLEWGSHGLPNGVHFDEQTACWAETVVGFLPSPATSELAAEDLDALRTLLPSWKPLPAHLLCVIVSDHILTAEYIEKRITPFLNKQHSNWTVRVVSPHNTEYSPFIGASLCIVVGGPDTHAKWSALWALPKECCVVEFQPELAMDGELQHLCHVASFKSWVLLLAKGSTPDLQDQVAEQFQKWYSKNRYEIRSGA